MLNFVRRQEVARGEALIDEVTEIAANETAWHGWLWKSRLAEARAEIAVARGDWSQALEWSWEAIEESRSMRSREIRGARTSARAPRRCAASGAHARRSAIERTGVRLARRVGDPGLFLRAASGLLALDGDDALAAEARALTSAHRRPAGAAVAVALGRVGRLGCPAHDGESLPALSLK